MLALSICANGGAPYGATVEIVGGAATCTAGTSRAAAFFEKILKFRIQHRFFFLNEDEVSRRKRREARKKRKETQKEKRK